MEDGSLNIVLREVLPGDEAFLLEVYASTRREELEGLGWAENQKQAFIKMQFLTREKTYPRTDDRIVLFNGRAIGRMMIDRREASILLRDIALLTEYRNAGLGSRLVQNLINEAASCGKPLQLHVLETSRAVRLYERLGFSKTGADAAYLEMTWTPPVSVPTQRE